MDFMKDIIANSKKDIASRKRTLDGEAPEGGGKKFFKRSEIQSRFGSRDRDEVDSDDDKEAGVAGKKKKTEDDAAATTRKNKKKGEDAERESAEELVISMEEMEVKRRLRSWQQPITLFGETARARWKRLKIFEVDAHERHGASKGVGNESRMLDQEVENEIMAATLDSGALDENQQAERKRREAKKQKLTEKYEGNKKREDFDSAEDFILWFFKRLLHLWELELDTRPTEEKATTFGRVASAIQKTTRKDMRPFFKHLKKKEEMKDVVEHVEHIAKFCLEKEYVRANERYMLLAIGNAAWPMGVTNVGIHERAGRSKIFTSQVAHVLNDEVQRKYIQAIKRLMSYSQIVNPTVPSKMCTS